MRERRWHDELPSVHELNAACWVARLFARDPSMTSGRSRDAYGRAATDGLFDRSELLRGEGLLMAAALIGEEDGWLTADPTFLSATDLQDQALRELILERLLATVRPLWVSAAATPTGLDDALVPDIVAADLRTVLPDPGRREAFLLAIGRRFDDTDRRHVGELAEEYVVRACRLQLETAGKPDLASKVRRVSMVSDQLGYDVVAPRRDESDRRLEVKGTRASGLLLPITISRNEADVGLRDSDWALVVCRVTRDDVAQTVGWLDGAALQPYLPSDPAYGGAWEAAVAFLDELADLTPGLPPC